MGNQKLYATLEDNLSIYARFVSSFGSCLHAYLLGKRQFYCLEMSSVALGSMQPGGVHIAGLHALSCGC
jgi:hypothetical protein